MPSTLAHRVASTVVVLSLAGLLGACGESYDELPSDAPTPMHFPSPSVSNSVSATPASPATAAASAPAAAADFKNQLDSNEAEALARTRLHRPTQAPVYSLISCRWTATVGGTKITTMEGTMVAWQDLVPAELIQSLRSLVQLSGDDCELFKAMTGSAKGSTSPGPDHLIRYVPSRQRPRTVDAQQCRRGRYSTVELTAPDLEPGPTLEAQMWDAMAAMAD
jgi:hypothetical protein